MQQTTRRRFLLASGAGALSFGCRPLAAGIDETSASPPAHDTVAVESPPASKPPAAAFLQAVESGDVAAVARFVAAAPDLVHAVDTANRSAVVLAYLSGHEPVAKLLLEHGADVGLVEAVMIPDWPRAEKLARADPSALNAWHPVGGTVLYAAARVGRGELWRLQALGADADGNPKGIAGVTPAHGAASCPDPIARLGAAVDLLSNGADVNAPQRDGDTLLHVAARQGDHALIRYLLRRGADSAARDAHGDTALDIAQRFAHTDAIALLQRAESVTRDDMRLRRAYDASGAPVKWPDLSDVSAAVQGQFTGSSHGRIAVVREMLAKDPRLAFSMSSQDELSIEACGHTGNRDVMRLLLDRGLPMSVCTAVSIGDLGRARALLEANPGSVNERGPHDFAAMWYAAIGGGNVAAAELLLAFGAGVDQASRGTTALHQAAARGHRDLAAFLIERGADVSAVSYTFDRAGLTPLGLARARKQDSMARFLSDRGAM